MFSALAHYKIMEFFREVEREESMGGGGVGGERVGGGKRLRGAKRRAEKAQYSGTAIFAALLSSLLLADETPKSFALRRFAP